MPLVRRLPDLLLPALLVLAAGIVLAQMDAPPETGAVAALAAAALLVAATWALVDLERFLLVAVLAAMILPAALVRPGGAQVALVDVLVLLAAAAWLVRSAAGVAPPPWVAGNRLLVPGLLFVGVTAASLSWSTAPGETVKAILQTAEIVVLVPIAFASLPRSTQTLRLGLLVFVAATSLLAVVAAVNYVPRAVGGDFSGQYLSGLHKNAIGSFVGAGLAIAYAYWLVERRPAMRRALTLAALVEVAGLFAAGSRGALAGTFLALVAVSLLLGRRRLLTLGLAAAGGLVTLAIATRLTAQDVTQGGYESSVVRGYSFDNAVDKIAEQPLLGTGAGTYFDFIPELDIGLTDPNNMLLLTWAELGLAGVLALAFLLYRFARLLVGARRLPTATAVPAIAAGGAAISLLVHFQVDATWTRGTATLTFAAMGILLAAGRLAGNRDVATRAGGAPPVAPAPGVASPPESEPVRLPIAPTRGRADPARAAELRVVHVVTSDAYAGIERHAVRLARELRALGCAAEIACPPSATRLRAAAAAVGVPAHPSVGRGRWIAATARALAADPPDVLHLHDGRAALAGQLLARFGRPVVVRTQHFTRPASVERGAWGRAASLALHRRLNRSVHGYVAVSSSVAQAAQARRDTAGAEVAVIPPGIDLPEDAAVAAARASRAALPHPVAAFVGRLEREKHVDVLLEAVPRVLERIPGCRFAIAGSGGEGPVLRRLAGRLGVEGAIAWRGEVADATVLLAGAHLYVNPSPAEGFGLATVEAMALALPVVAVAAGASAEIVDDEVTGLLVAPDDASALAAAIARLAADRALAERMGDEARRRAVSRYGIEATARATLDLYRRLREQVRS